MKTTKILFFHGKICFEVYRIHYNFKKWVNKFSNFESQLGGRGGGGPAELVKNQLFNFF